MSTVVALICHKHGFTQGATCPRCDEAKTSDTVHINTGEWIVGDYEHIDPKGPIHIESKEQLIQECSKMGLLAKSLMKPKSQGQGYEMR